MRRRFVTIALVMTTLSAPMLLGAAGASTDAGAVSSPAGTSKVGNLAPPNSAGLEELIMSLIDGSSPLITEVPPSQPFSPFGQDVVDESGENTILDEFELIVNPAPLALPADFDLDGNVDVSTEGNPQGPAADEPATLVRVGGDEPLNQLWGDYPFLDGFSDATIPTFGGTQTDMIDGLLTDLGLDPFSSDAQQVMGVDVRVARPTTDGIPYRGPITIWGGHTRSNYGSGIDCSRSMYDYEFGRAFLRAGGLQWEPGTSFPKDLFTGISDATIIRCKGDWQIDYKINTGVGFESMPTNTKAMIFSNGYIAFTPAEEFVNTIGYRAFSFRTPAFGGYQAGNTIATTYPTFPELMKPMTTVVVGSPFPSADHGPIPFMVDMASLSTDPTGPCSGDWSAIFELYLWDKRSDGVMDAAMYQFTSGQWTAGSLSFEGGNPRLVTEGSGDGYSEMYDLIGGIGTYTYNSDSGECSYTASIGDGLDTLIAALTEFAPASEVTEPTPPPSSSGGSAPASSTPSTPSSTPTTSGSGGDDTGGGFPWGVVSVIAGLVLLAAGYGVTRTRGDDGDETPTPTGGTGTAPTAVATTATDGPCDRLRRMYESAKGDADSKRTAADDADDRAGDAETEAGRANSDAKDATTAADDAERDRKKAERARNAPPDSESESWIEDSDTGERITGTDLRLRREAAAAAWDDYRSDPSPESAAHTESDWSQLDDDGARAGRRSDWEADQAKRAKDLAEAEAAKDAADTARDEANEARDAADRAARDARAEADRLDTEAAEAEARAAELKRKLDECLGLMTGDPTRWGGPVGVGEDPDGGCFPEGNIERRVLDTFDKTVNVNWWVTVRPTSTAPSDARKLAGELRWWRDAFGTGSSAINVYGALKGLTSRTVGAAAETTASGASVVAGDALGIDIPTDIRQVPLVILEGAAATSAAIIDKWGEWIANNHVEHIAQFGFQVKDVKMTWVEIWKCQGGQKRCVERVLEIEMSDLRDTGSIRSETFQPRENWQRRVDGLGRTMASQAQRSSQDMVDFMGKHRAGPC